MSVHARMAGIPEGGMADKRLLRAISMGKDNMQELVAIANGAPPKDGIDSMYATMALNIIGPALKAQKAQQAQQQPKQPSVKDQVVADAADTGLAALPAENVMTEQAMAAGGIVAFQGGGEIEDLTKELNELMRQKREQRSSVGTFRAPAPYATSPLDAKIADVQRRLQLAQNKSGFLAERTAMREQGITPAEFGTPLDILQTQQAQQAQQAQQTQQGKQAPQGQQAPGAGGAGYPGVNKAMANLRGLYSEVDKFDPMQTMLQFEAGPYERFLPKSAEDIRAQRAEAEAELRKMYPESREAAEEMMAKRYAGLEDMYKKREARGAEELKIAEKEKGQTAGLGLMQLASELVTKPLQKIDTSAAFQTFKDANKTYAQARKDFNASKDKIDEARELQKIGQFEKADALYREGAKGVFDFKMQTAQLENAQDTARKSGLLSLAGKGAQAQADKLAKKIELGNKEVDTALGVAKLESEERQAGIYAASRFSGADKYSYAQAKDDATQFIKNNPRAIQKQFGKNPMLMDAAELQRVEDALIRSFIQSRSGLQSGAAAPSGGGAGGLDLSQWGDPKLKTR